VFDGLRPAPRGAAGPLRDARALEARLLPDGHVALPGAQNALEAEVRELLPSAGVLPDAER
jgi:hypothetical protein